MRIVSLVKLIENTNYYQHGVGLIITRLETSGNYRQILISPPQTRFLVITCGRFQLASIRRFFDPSCKLKRRQSVPEAFIISNELGLCPILSNPRGFLPLLFSPCSALLLFAFNGTWLNGSFEAFRLMGLAMS